MNEHECSKCSFAAVRHFFQIEVAIKVVVPEPRDLPKPNIKMFCRSIQIELCTVTSGLCAGLAKTPHCVQCLELRQLEQGLRESVDLPGQLRCRPFSIAMVPGCPPFMSVIVRPGIDQLTGRMLQMIKREQLLWPRINMAEAAGRRQNRPITLEIRNPPA